MSSRRRRRVPQWSDSAERTDRRGAIQVTNRGDLPDEPDAVIVARREFKHARDERWTMVTAIICEPTHTEPSEDWSGCHGGELCQDYGEAESSEA